MVVEDSTAKRVNVSRTLGGDEMKKYRIRERSIFDYARYGFVGFVFGMVMAAVASTVPL